MKIAITQLNYVVGDSEGNAASTADAVTRAGEGGASLVLTTELAVGGFSPAYLLVRDGSVVFRAPNNSIHRRSSEPYAGMLSL
jgi:predicted amidohydrolase